MKQAAVPLLSGGQPKPQNRLMNTVAAMQQSFKRAVKTFGPGLMVCLADTDGACLVTAAQSGAVERYKLLMLQIVLIPVLYIAQELTIRLALYRQKGLVGCVRSSIGYFPAVVIAVALIATCIGALISEVANIASAMRLIGVPSNVTAVVTCLALLGLAVKGSYSDAENVGLCLGSLQVVFFILMFLSQPRMEEILEDAVQFPIRDPAFGNLVTANIGAVIMPWMLAYQQSACALDGTPTHELQEKLDDHRFETKVGSVITQGVMSAVLVMAAAVTKRSIKNIDDLAALSRTICGSSVLGNAITLFAVVGASIVAAIVVMLCAAWVIEDMVKSEKDSGLSLPGIREDRSHTIPALDRIKARPAYFSGIILSVAASLIVVVTFGDEEVGFIDVLTQVLNGVLMVPVVMALWYLAVYHMPDCALTGFRCWLTAFIFAVCSIFSLVGVIQQG